MSNQPWSLAVGDRLRQVESRGVGTWEVEKLAKVVEGLVLSNQPMKFG